MITDLTPRPEFGEERSRVLADAIKTVRGLESELGPGTVGTAAPVEVAERLFRQLDRAVAEFDRSPEIYPLKEDYFTGHGASMPVSFKDLTERYGFYWMRLPIVLKPADDMPFVKLQCAIEFNPRAQSDEPRPRALMIFPDKKFKSYMEINDSLQVGVGANAELEVAAGIPTLQAGQNKFATQGAAQAKVGGRIDVRIGPFNYTWKKAVVDHSPVGTGKVFWQLDGAEFLADDGPNFVAVLQIPKGMEQVEIAAVLRAYPRFDLLTANIKRVLRYFTSKTRGFLEAGAPVEHNVLWDISSSLESVRAA
jgi:hypothetical protein